MSTYKGRDDCTDQILDFVAGGVALNPSGESDGNYNAVIGDAHATDDLSQYTLAEIYDLMAELKKSEPSTALGRYQFIERTLQGLQQKKGLSDDTLFTRELEDQLAVSLLVGRGYPAWWDGKISDEEFAHNLSLEWASLPDPQRDGRSHYDGDGINSASTTLDHVYSMLKTARAAQQAPVAPAPAKPEGPMLYSVQKGADALPTSGGFLGAVLRLAFAAFSR